MVSLADRGAARGAPDGTWLLHRMEAVAQTFRRRQRNDLEAIAKALDLRSVDELESLASFPKGRADYYKRYPDLKSFTRRRRRGSWGS